MGIHLRHWQCSSWGLEVPGTQRLLLLLQPVCGCCSPLGQGWGRTEPSSVLSGPCCHTDPGRKGRNINLCFEGTYSVSFITGSRAEYWQSPVCQQTVCGVQVNPPNHLVLPNLAVFGRHSPSQRWHRAPGLCRADRVAVHGSTTVCTPCSLWELQQLQVLQLVLQFVTDRRKMNPWACKGGSSVWFSYCGNGETWEVHSAELWAPREQFWAAPVSDGTAWGHQVGQRKRCLGFPSLVLPCLHLFRVDQAKRTMWFVLAAKEKQRCFIHNGGQGCSSPWAPGAPSVSPAALGGVCRKPDPISQVWKDLNVNQLCLQHSGKGSITAPCEVQEDTGTSKRARTTHWELCGSRWMSGGDCTEFLVHFKFKWRE